MMRVIIAMMMAMKMTTMITDSVIPDDCHIFFQRAAFPSSPVTCNLDNDDGHDFDYHDMPLKQARKPLSYASSKLCPPTDSLTGVRCRATSVAKIYGVDKDQYEYENVVKMGMVFFFTSRHCSSPKDRDSYVTLGSPGSQSL